MPTYVVSRAATGPTFHKRFYATERAATPQATQVRKYGVYALGGVTIVPTKGQIWPLGSRVRRR